MTEELLVITKLGPEEPEKLLMPFIVANTALAMDIPVTMFFMASAVELAVKGKAEQIPKLESMPELPSLLKSIIELGADIQLCGPCSNHRGITPDQLIENAVIGGAAGLVDLVMNRKVVSF
jgi:predicted peroxiredoxin